MTRDRGPVLKLALILTALLVQPSPAVAETPNFGTSLDWVPADAAFYASSMRIKERIEIIAKSNAWKELSNSIVGQMAGMYLQMFTAQGMNAEMTQFLGDPENQELMALAADAFSDEAFIYGERSFVDFAALLHELSRSGQLLKIQIGESTDTTADELVQAREWFRALDARSDRLVVPAIMIGWKLSDMPRAQRQIARLENLLGPILDAEPLWKERLKRVTTDGVEYLTLEMDGGMIPWESEEQVFGKKLDEQPGEFDALRTKLRKMKLVVSLGIRDGYLLLSVGESLDHLAKLGKVPSLATAHEFEPMAKRADKRFIKVAYLSKPLRELFSPASTVSERTVGSSPISTWDWFHLFLQSNGMANLTEEQSQEIEKDLKELAADLQPAPRKIGAWLSFSFLTPHGIEGYTYDWSEHRFLNDSKPLGLLQYAGGDPILAYAIRLKYPQGGYALLQKWALRIYARFDEYFVSTLSEEDQKEFRKFAELWIPLLKRIDKTTSEKLLPALADGQWGFVLDAKVTLDQWATQPSRTNIPLPMPAPAILVGISDANLLKQAAVEYRSAVDDFLQAARKADLGDVPEDAKIPDAESSVLKAGNRTANIYWYKLPEEFEAGGSEILPNAGVCDDACVLSLFTSQTERLLSPTPLDTSPHGPLSAQKRPLISAFYFNWHSLLNAVRPWIDSSLRENFGKGITEVQFEGETIESLSGEEDAEATMLGLTAGILLRVAKVLNRIETATYFEDGALVTHSLVEIQDLAD